MGKTYSHECDYCLKKISRTIDDSSKDFPLDKQWEEWEREVNEFDEAHKECRTLYYPSGHCCIFCGAKLGGTKFEDRSCCEEAYRGGRAGVSALGE